MIISMELTAPITNVLEAIQPFMPDDGHKGTFLVLRIAGLEQGLALKSVKRKYRSWQHWRSTDEDFYRIDEAIPMLAQRFGGEARVLRTALLDIQIVETGVHVFRRILESTKPVSDSMWAYATRLMALRVPMMGLEKAGGNNWEILANSIKHSMSQKELEYKEVSSNGSARSIIAREVTVVPSLEQQQVTNNIVAQILSQAQGAESP